MKSILQNDKTKLVFKIALAVVLLFAIMFTMTACGGEKADAKVSTNDTKVAGITVKLNKTTTKEFVEGVDSSSRVDLYGALGELKQYNVSVEGTVSIADCNENAIAMNDGNVVEDDVTPVGYYTDFFELELLVPEGATKVGFIDGNSLKLDSEIDNVDKDGYYTENVQWLLGTADKSSWSICGNAETNDGYFYYKFLNDENKIIDQFFVCVTYDVEFVSEVATYDELVKAITYNNSTVILKNDIDIQDQLDINKEITLDLNGHKIYNSEIIWSDVPQKTSLISIYENGNLTIKGNGKLTALKDDVYAITVWDGGEVNIMDGEFIGNVHTVYVYEGTANIYGGTFALDQKSQYDDSRFLINLYDANGKAGIATINVYGGTFIEFNPSDNLAENPQVDFVAEGYKSVLVEGSETDYVVVKIND